MEYELIFSRRKTLGLEVRRDGSLIVRAPYRTAQKRISEFVAANAAWIDKARARQQERSARHPEPDTVEIQRLQQDAVEYLPQRLAYFAAKMQLAPTGLTITSARTRFGSCSGKNRICFSWRLMAYPKAAIDYVIVHELAHIKHKNHGPDFWALVECYMPDYRERKALLR